jgi:hypothetical protein
MTRNGSFFIFAILETLFANGKETTMGNILSWSCYQNAEQACGRASYVLRLRGFRQARDRMSRSRIWSRRSIFKKIYSLSILSGKLAWPILSRK